MRWTNSLDTILESDVCQSVYVRLPGNYSTPRIICVDEYEGKVDKNTKTPWHFVQKP